MLRSLILFLVVALPFSAAAKKPTFSKKTGFLVLPKMLGQAQLAQHAGFVAPRLIVFKPSGELVNSRMRGGGFPAGAVIPLAEGWYVVRVGTELSGSPAFKYFVKARQVTLVETGIVAVTAAPPSEQPKLDRCRAWNGALKVYFKGKLVGRNDASKVGSIGMVQLHSGTYRVQWHGLRTTAVVKADTIYSLPRGYISPQKSADDHRLAQKKSFSPGVPILTLCKKDSTQILSGTFWETYKTPSKKPPYQTLVWQKRTIEPSEGGTYTKQKPLRLRGFRRYRGKGSRPLALPDFKPLKSVKTNKSTLTIKPL